MNTEDPQSQQFAIATRKNYPRPWVRRKHTCHLVAVKDQWSTHFGLLLSAGLLSFLDLPRVVKLCQRNLYQGPKPPFPYLLFSPQQEREREREGMKEGNQGKKREITRFMIEKKKEKKRIQKWGKPKKFRMRQDYDSSKVI